MTNLGRAVMWILAGLIHIQFWVGFNATWRLIFPDAYQIIDAISTLGILLSMIPTLHVAHRIIP